MRRILTTALLLALPVSATAETIKLDDGDVINAPIISRAGGVVTIDHPTLGEVAIPREKIAAIYEDPDAMAAAEAEAAAADKAAALEAERAADDGLFGTGIFKGWNRRLELGLTGAEGNSQNINFRTAFHTDYEDDEDRWIFDTVYRASKSDGTTTENKFYAQLTKDWLFPEEKYFVFANGRYDWDEFQDWDSRWSGFLGAGYQFLDDEKWNVRGRAGLGGNQEMGGAQGDEFTLEALLGVEADYKINEDQSIAFTNYFYPSLEDAADFRNVTTLDYVIAIDKDKGIDLKIGIANEHDSSAPATTKKNDFTYYISLVWKF
jgi:putative salt-induced outer membrane protein YdiY